MLMAAFLILIILKPALIYANKTTHNNFTIYHQKKLDPSFLTSLDEASKLLQESEFYNPNLEFDICLNDGSTYPTLIKTIRGQAFAWGFYNKVVLQGNANYKDKHIELNGYRWNLTQLISHEMTHCLQFDQLGLLKSNPIANFPNWKWEGYAEYVSRQYPDQKNLTENINRLLSTDKSNWEINFADSTIASREYYEYWILMQYCVDIKKMTFHQILEDTTQEQIIQKEMMGWFEQSR